MTPTKVNATARSRLYVLADFLDRLTLAQFDFDHIIFDANCPLKYPGCGTIGCAIGWTPHVFPDLVKYGWSGDGNIRIQKNASKMSRVTVMSRDTRIGERRPSYTEIASDIFDIPRYHARVLFAPRRDDPDIPPLVSSLGGNATPQQVASRIRDYANWAGACDVLAIKIDPCGLLEKLITLARPPHKKE